MSNSVINPSDFVVNIDDLPIHITIYQVKEGDVYLVDLNVAAQVNEKLNKNELIGKKLLEEFPSAKTSGLFDTILEVYKTGESQNLDLMLYQDTHAHRWKKNYVIKLSNGNIMSLFDDLTVQKKLELELTKEKKRLEDAQKLAHLGSWEWNIVDNSLSWSDEVFRIIGEQPQSFIPTYEKFTSYIPINELAAVESAISESLATTQNYNVIHRVIRSDGGVRFVQETGIPFFDDNGEPSHMIGTVYDITETHNFKVELEKTSSELHTVFEVNPHITFITDGQKILTVNRKFLAFTGCKTLLEFKVKHKCFSELFISREGYLDPAINKHNWVAHVAHNPEQSHKVLMVKSDCEYTFSAHATRYSLDNHYKYIVVLEDISELEKHAKTDYLTQLYTRHKVHEMLQLNFDQFQRYGQVFSIIMLDIDHFKKINDSFGHQVGDSVLKKIASIIQAKTRTTDTVGRWGGEEFLIICPNSDIHDTYKLAECLRTTIENYHVEPVGKNTASLGVHCIQQDMSIEQLIHGADQALYYAKNNKRNRSVKYHAHLTEL
ncbi:GGDEF domain-containing protein [Thiomicrorhabdus arctica]|uniref:GGDEF domain-containing protein n=1 Tax=Thiomicrorhabdus arctica TaxID=131540 RepID=UPI00036D562E|nr:sensor domain-containing diguanylate cyclase [Thiomicrorhabdus arctica]